jgi:hypothetical protein
VHPNASYEWRRQLVWGLVVVGVGVALLLDSMQMIHVESMWHYAPLLLVIVGMNKMVGYPTARHFTSGLWEMILGLWLFAVFERMYGLTFGNSWPILVIAFGAKMALEPWIRARFAVDGNEGHGFSGGAHEKR